MYLLFLFLLYFHRFPPTSLNQAKRVFFSMNWAKIGTHNIGEGLYPNNSYLYFLSKNSDMSKESSIFENN